MIGVFFEWILKGPATAMGTIAAQGTLDSDEDQGAPRTVEEGNK